jgi:hypothetical protein
LVSETLGADFVRVTFDNDTPPPVVPAAGGVDDGRLV